MMGLTRRQREALLFVQSYERRFNHAPTYRQIMAALGLRSPSGVHRLIGALIDRGCVEHTDYEWRSLTVVHPVSGTVALKVEDGVVRLMGGGR